MRGTTLALTDERTQCAEDWERFGLGGVALHQAADTLENSITEEMTMAAFEEYVVEWATPIYANRDAVADINAEIAWHETAITKLNAALVALDKSPARRNQGGTPEAVLAEVRQIWYTT